MLEALMQEGHDEHRFLPPYPPLFSYGLVCYWFMVCAK